jgi:hypothetical protein
MPSVYASACCVTREVALYDLRLAATEIYNNERAVGDSFNVSGVRVS